MDKYLCRSLVGRALTVTSQRLMKKASASAPEGYIISDVIPPVYFAKVTIVILVTTALVILLYLQCHDYNSF